MSPFVSIASDVARPVSNGSSPRAARGARTRNGAILLAALIALLLTMLMAATLAKSLAMHRRQLRVDLMRAQACWLAESAVQRAVVQLQVSAGYQGETWRASADLEGVESEGSARIRVTNDGDDSCRRKIIVEASWPEANGPEETIDRILEQRELTIEISDSGATP